ncbi:cytidine deaminase [Paucibacter sp. R3-3]|uniref:Cytidine deaminase n=1 Tax=Roseateles agri TaxID=3098619 RepID=A0ABU5DIS9_9BURK|nr:cytidine deaminase [Paucibacter sp. R3-3]MDY0746192.1 cytidine deaminase [Paucibacter sp. R3-3]
MGAVMDPADQALLQASLAARKHSHSPYSGYAVGAAILDEQGRIHAGANIENAAYPQGLCAEAIALGAMVMAGGKRAVAVLVTGPGPDLITPCGGCRQKLREFAGPGLRVIAGDPGGIRSEWTLEELLPHSFGPDHLNLHLNNKTTTT